MITTPMGRAAIVIRRRARTTGRRARGAGGRSVAFAGLTAQRASGQQTGPETTGATPPEPGAAGLPAFHQTDNPRFHYPEAPLSPGPRVQPVGNASSPHSRWHLTVAGGQ